jgi:hypothetical protein
MKRTNRRNWAGPPGFRFRRRRRNRRKERRIGTPNFSGPRRSDNVTFGLAGPGKAISLVFPFFYFVLKRFKNSIRTNLKVEQILSWNKF